MKENEMESGVVSRRGIEIVRGEGARIWNAYGNMYIDMGASYGVCNVGHCNPEVQEAVRSQIGRLMYVSSSYDNPERRELMAKLIDLAPKGMGRVFLCNSGTEAVEAALKFSVHQTGKRKIIAAKRSFHGRTLGSLSVTWNPKHRNVMEGSLLETEFVTYGDIEDLRKKIDDITAAVILEPIQGEGGVHLPPDGYFQEVRRICDENGALLIVDEVQTGLGRTGYMFAIEKHGIIPDLICLGKSLGGGIPIAAVLINERLGSMPTGLHGSTFGGNPVACSAANAVLDYLVVNDLPGRAKISGTLLLDGIGSIDSPVIREVRGQGLMIAIELKKKAGPYLSKLLENRIAAIPSGSTVIRLLPPLVIAEEDIKETIKILGEVLNE
jgi:acetylornithine/LysW-gamma-L-lysine aminotransferase